MRKIFCFIVLLLISSVSFAQNLTVDHSNLSFGNVFENAPDSLQLIITNSSASDTVAIQDILFYEKYGHTDFSVAQNSFEILPGAAHSIWVRFSPRHNVAYNSELVIISDDQRGSVSVDLQGQGKYSNTYYSSSENKSEQALKTALKSTITNGFQQKSYNAARDQMFMIIDNQKTNGQGASQNHLEGVYTGRTVIGYVGRSDAQASHFNTEHTWPQSLFSRNLPMRSDLHHLYPTYDQANSRRGSFPFGTVSGSPSWQDGGSKLGNNIFEPRGVQKGATARAMFYFAIRYQNYGNFLNSQEAILKQWSDLYLPTAVERKRNADIHSFQRNRNPFTDYPQFLERISSVSTNSTAVNIFAIDKTETEINYGKVASSQDFIYHYILVNKGNQTLQLSNLSLSDAVLSFDGSSGNNASIAAGEALGLDIKLNSPSGILNATLDFSTNIPSQSTVSIPVKADVGRVLSINPPVLASSVDIFPNPAHDRLNIAWPEANNKSANINLFTISGKRILQRRKRFENGELQLKLPNLDAGIYLISVKQGSQSWSEKIMLD